jgi:hypothetical protein
MTLGGGNCSYWLEKSRLLYCRGLCHTSIHRIKSFWIRIKLTKPYDGKPATFLGWNRPSVFITESYFIPWRLYALRYSLMALWSWFLFMALTQSNAFSLLWFFAFHSGQVMEVGGWLTPLRWFATSFSAEAAFMQALSLTGLGTSALWHLAKKGNRITVTPDYVQVGSRLFGKRYALASCKVVLRPHPWATWEKTREEKKQREASMKGQKRLPQLPHYARHSFQAVLAHEGQPRVLATIHGEANAEAFVTRLQWAIDRMAAIEPETDWWRLKRKWASGLGGTGKASVRAFNAERGAYKKEPPVLPEHQPRAGGSIASARPHMPAGRGRSVAGGRKGRKTNSGWHTQGSGAG